MKFAICILSLVISSNVFASQVTLFPLYATSIASATISGQKITKEAVQVLNDVQDYNQSGHISAFLEQKIIDAQSVNDSISETEALDILINDAEAILN